MAISKIVTNSVDSGVTLTSPVINTITSAAATALTLQSAGTTAITVDTSQNVGIGTSVNSVYDAVAQPRPLVVQSASATTTQYGSTNALVICNSDTTANNASQLNFAAITGASTNQYTSAAISCIYGARTNTVYPSGILTFATSTATQAPVERMRIDSSGNLLVGTTSTAFPSSDAKTVSLTNSVQTAFFANVNAASSTGTAGIVIRKYDNNNTTSQIYLHCNYNQGLSGAGGIQGNGASGIQFYSSSDARLKENIVELEPQLANILALKPSKFDYIDGPKDCTGFIAQEMETVYPDAIGEGEDGYKTIGGVSIMETRLIKAIQEQQALILALTARLETLEAK